MKTFKLILKVFLVFGIIFPIMYGIIHFFSTYDLKLVKQKPQYWHGEELVFENYIPWSGDEIWIVRDNRVKDFWTYNNKKWKKGEIVFDDSTLKDLPDEGNHQSWDKNPVEKF